MNEPSPNNIPGWAKNIDDYGKRRWSKEKSLRNRRAEYITAIVWNLIWLFVVNKVQDWHLQFINDHYPAVLWALNMNIFIQIGGNILMLIFDFRFIRYLSRMIIETANFFILIILYYIYPFDFSHVPGWSFLDWLIPWMMIIGMIVSALKVVGNTWKLIFWR
jgi:hypothetical protein